MTENRDDDTAADAAAPVAGTRRRWIALAVALVAAAGAVAAPLVAAQPESPARFPQDRWLGGDGAMTITVVGDDVQQVRERALGTLGELVTTLPPEALVAIEQTYGIDPELPVARDLVTTVDASGQHASSVSVYVRTEEGDRQVAEYSHRADRSGDFVLAFAPPLSAFPALDWDARHPERFADSVASLGTYDEAGEVLGVGTYEHSVVHRVDDAGAGCVSATRTLRVYLPDESLAGEVVIDDGWCADASAPDLGGGQRRSPRLVHPAPTAGALPPAEQPPPEVLARLVDDGPAAGADPTAGDGAMVAVGDVFVRSSVLAGDLVARWPEGAVAWQAHPGGRITSVASDGRLLAAATASPSVVVYDGTGTRRWTRSVDDLAMGVVIAGGRVFVATLDGRLAAFDGMDGRPLWSVHAADTPLALAAVGDRSVALADASGAISLYDATTGSRRWEATMGGVEQLAATGSLVLASSGLDVAAFDAATGDERWAMRAPGAQLVVAGDVVWSLGPDGSTALEPATGSIIGRGAGADRFAAFADGSLLAVDGSELRSLVGTGVGGPPAFVGQVCPGAVLAASADTVVGWCADGSWLTTAGGADPVGPS